MSNKGNYSNLGVYGSDITKFKLLTPEREKMLCFNIRKGDIKSRDELITSNLGLVIKLAMYYKDRGVDANELICEGNKGLITAATKFDPTLENRFSTYAYIWIKQAMLSCIESSKLWSSTSNENVLNYDDYSDKRLAVDMTEFEQEDDSNIKDIIRRIDGLPKRDSSIVKHYFGVSGHSELNTIELSEKFNISTMRVSNIIETAIRKIRCDVLENI